MLKGNHKWPEFTRIATIFDNKNSKASLCDVVTDCSSTAALPIFPILLIFVVMASLIVQHTA